MNKIEKLQRLLGLLARLRAGDRIGVGTYVSVPTEDGDEGMSPSLMLFKGHWLLEELNCTSPTCSHYSHDRVRVVGIKRKEALLLLKSRIERDERAAAEKAAEIAWLDQAIKETSS